MGSSTSKTKLESTALWALLGILATIILGVPGIYYTVHEKHPHVSYEIVNHSEVLDVHQPVKDLEIRYRGEDIYAQKKNLRVLTIMIRNDGEVHIKQEDFDKSMPWGLQLAGGQLVDRPKLIGDNSSYIHENINLAAATNNLITFQKIIFEREKYFAVELQILHRIDDEPQLTVVGKIAGIENPVVTISQKDRGATNFWQQVFYGNLSVQLVRILIFGAGVVIILIAILFIVVVVSEAISECKKKRVIKQMDVYLGALLRGKSESDQKFTKQLLVHSKGKLESLEKSRTFLQDPEKVKLFLNSIGDDSVKRGKFPSLVEWDARIGSRFVDADIEPFEFGFACGLFFCRSQGQKGFSLRPDTVKTLDELIEHIRENEIPPRLRKQLGSLNWWDLSNKTTVEVSVC
jgi:hypothetical protein